MAEKALPSLLERHWAESALAIGAVFIAGVSLWVAYDSERTNREIVGTERQLVSSERKLVAESVWPFVEQTYGTFIVTGGSVNPKRVERVMITNAGIGPAKVETFELFWRRKAYPTWPALARVCCNYTQRSHSEDNLNTSSIGGSVLRAGQTLSILYYPRTTANSSMWQALHEAIPNVHFKICYCSVFDQCWVTDGETLHPKLVTDCPVVVVPYAG